jgi:ribosomal protein S18 acetylase RimI-like enzyme
MKLVPTDKSNKDFLKMCAELNTALNFAVAGREGIYNTLQSIDKVFYVVLAREKSVAGMAAISKVDDTTAEIRCVFVRPDFRKKGIARAMCLHLEDTARSLGYKNMILDTWAQLPFAIKLYESLGYARTEGEIVHAIDKDCVYMRKCL